MGDSKPLKPNYIEMDNNKIFPAEKVSNKWQIGNVDVKITDIKFSD